MEHEQSDLLRAGFFDSCPAMRRQAHKAPVSLYHGTAQKSICLHNFLKVRCAFCAGARLLRRQLLFCEKTAEARLSSDIPRPGGEAFYDEKMLFSLAFYLYFRCFSQRNE